MLVRWGAVLLLKVIDREHARFLAFGRQLVEPVEHRRQRAIVQPPPPEFAAHAVFQLQLVNHPACEGVQPFSAP